MTCCCSNSLSLLWLSPQAHHGLVCSSCSEFAFCCVCTLKHYHTHTPFFTHAHDTQRTLLIITSRSLNVWFGYLTWSNLVEFDLIKNYSNDYHGVFFLFVVATWARSWHMSEKASLNSFGLDSTSEALYSRQRRVKYLNVSLVIIVFLLSNWYNCITSGEHSHKISSQLESQCYNLDLTSTLSFPFPMRRAGKHNEKPCNWQFID